jgi:hypothetical protein
MVLNIVVCRIKLKRIRITQEHSVQYYLRQKGVLLLLLFLDCTMKDWEKYIYKF